jgi:putative ABC transport system permease protein
MAWRYQLFHKERTVVLIAAITLITNLPLSEHILLRASETQMLARSKLSPLIIGQKCSSLDLVLNTLYFTSYPPAVIPMGVADRVYASDLAYAFPVYYHFVARGFPIVGTTVDYFDFRQLDIAAGRMLAVLGDCVLGATVASTLGLEPGDTLLSAPENAFDLAGVYPLKMQVVGVLHASHTPDDRAVFVDVKTAWVIEGLGHGHTDLATTTDPQNIIKHQNGTIVASAKVVQYTEITPANIDSFHFHGNTATFPLTAILAVPHDDKSATLLRGRYLGETLPSQIVRPTEVIAALLQNVFKFKQVLDIIFTVVSVAMLLAIVLIMTLSLRLRQPEIETMYKLGCSRLKMTELVAAELGSIALVSLILTAGLTVATLHWQLTIMHRFLA